MGNKDTKRECTELLKELRREYEYEEPDAFESGDITTRKIKWIIQNRLDKVESTIILLYAECGSLRKLGSMLNVSHSTIRPEVNRIKSKIQEELNNMENIENI